MNRQTLSDKLDAIRQIAAKMGKELDAIHLEKRERYYCLYISVHGGNIPVSNWYSAKDMSVYLDGLIKGLSWC